MKRYRKIEAKPGQLRMKYGKDEDGETDICYAWGDGVDSCDGRLLHNFVSSQPYSVLGGTYGKALLCELESRGYDLKTIEFSIRKKS